jgi:hypothetical protein
LQSAVATATASLCCSSPLRVVFILAPTAATAADPQCVASDSIILRLTLMMAWIRLLSAVGAGEGAEQIACIGTLVISVPVPLTRVSFSLLVPRLFPCPKMSLALAFPGDRGRGVAVVARPLTR